MADATPVSYAAKLASLMAMGFAEERCAEVLARYPDAMNAAINELLNPSPIISAPARPAAAAAAPPGKKLGGGASDRLRRHGSAVASSSSSSASAAHHFMPPAPAASLPAAHPGGFMSGLPPLSAGYLYGEVKMVRELDFYGFIQPADLVLPQAFFHFSDVYSPTQPTKRFAQVEDDVFLAPGDIVSFKHLPSTRKNKETGVLEDAWKAVEVKLVQYAPSRPPHLRRSQRAVKEGANAPAAGGVAEDAHMMAARPSPRNNAGGGAASSSSSCHAAAAAAADPTVLPAVALRALEGQQLYGTVTRVPSLPQAGAARVLPPHGFLAVHHPRNDNILFRLDEFVEVSSSAHADAAMQSLVRRLHVGEVLSFTLAHSADGLGFHAKAIKLVGSRRFKDARDEAEQHRRQRMEAEATAGALRSLQMLSPALLVRGAKFPAGESLTLEFKSLTRSGSMRGRDLNLLELATKYLNGFVNSAGGTLMVGVEDDGEIVGLTFSSSQQDALCQQVSACMREMDPPLDPDMWRISFIPVVALFKSSWAVAADEHDADVALSLGALQAEHSSDAQMREFMHQPDADDRIVQLHQRVVVALSIVKRPDGIPYYSTNRRHGGQAQVWLRGAADTTLMPVKLCVERTKACEANEGQDLRNEVQRLQKMVMQMAQAQAAAASAAPAAAAASAIHPSAQVNSAPAASAAAPASSRSRSASTTAASSPEFDSSRALRPAIAASSSSSSSSASSPVIAGPLFELLLSVLLPMNFSRADVLSAIESLHDTHAHVFVQDTPLEVQVSAVCERILQPQQHMSASASAPGSGQPSPRSRPRAESDEGEPEYASATSFAPAAAFCPSLADASSSSSAYASSIPASSSNGQPRLSSDDLAEVAEIEHLAASTLPPSTGKRKDSPLSLADNTSFGRVQRPASSAYAPSMQHAHEREGYGESPEGSSASPAVASSSASSSAVAASASASREFAECKEEAEAAGEESDAAPMSVNDNDDDAGLPCEVCGEMVNFAHLESHQQRCAQEKKQRDQARDHAAALALQKSLRKQ